MKVFLIFYRAKIVEGLSILLKECKIYVKKMLKHLRRRHNEKDNYAYDGSTYGFFYDCM